MTIKLSDMQLVLLTTACQRKDGSLLPPPESLGHQAIRIRKAVAALIKHGLAIEYEGVDDTRAWRRVEEIIFGVMITEGGRAIVEPESAIASTKPEVCLDATIQRLISVPAIIANTRPATKQALVLNLLKRAGGTTLPEIVSETGWLPHTSRAALTGLRKKGHAITADKRDGVTHYRIDVAA
ncbi:MAG: DUF3489 domain-containing protein [Sphingomonadaceae bacterium]